MNYQRKPGLIWLWVGLCVGLMGTSMSVAANPFSQEKLPGLKIPNVALQNQNGETIQFYQDLVQGKRVAINTIYTSCTTICSPMGVIFTKLLQELGENSEYHLISISIDPLTDTPERLKLWQDRFHAGAGWTLVTGSKSQVDRLLKQLKLYTPDKEDHSPLVLVGNDHTGEWTRTHALVSPKELAQTLAMLNPPES